MTPEQLPQEIEKIERLPVQAREDVSLPQGLPTLTEGDLARVEEFVRLIVRVKKIILQATNESDWVRIGKKPYLSESGCKKVAQVMGINLRGLEVIEQIQQVEGETIYRYTARVTAEWVVNGRIRSTEELGEADSNDPFFREYTDSSGEKRKKPLSEVRLGHVKKKAVTNAMNRGIKSILALNGTSWEDVTDAGVKEERTSSVQYGASKERRADRTGDAGGDEKTRLKNIIADLALWENVTFEDILHDITEFKGKDDKVVFCRDFAKLSGAWLTKTLAKAEKSWKDHPANQREPGQDGGEDAAK